MSRRVIISSQAEEDIARAAAWYEARKEGLGEQFADRVQETIERIKLNPVGYQIVYRGLRRASLRQFKDWGVFFTIRLNHSLVIACLSGKRHPSLAIERAAGVKPIKPPAPG